MTNVGTIDMFIRITLGITLLSLLFFGPKTSWGWLGLIPLLTAVINFCPLYKLFGISTHKVEH